MHVNHPGGNVLCFQGFCGLQCLADHVTDRNDRHIVPFSQNLGLADFKLFIGIIDARHGIACEAEIYRTP
jgi:hypothetical protein